MMVRISDIPHSGLQIDDTIPLATLNERMHGGARGEDLTFTVAPTISVHITPTPHGAECKGTVRSKLRQACARCSVEVERAIEAPLNFMLLPRRADQDEPTADEAHELPAEDIGVVYFDGDHFDLETVAQENLILSLSLYWSPPCDRKEQCTHCHQPRSSFESTNDHHGTSLGTLLKRAGVHSDN